MSKIIIEESEKSIKKVMTFCKENDISFALINQELSDFQNS